MALLEPVPILLGENIEVERIELGELVLRDAFSGLVLLELFGIAGRGGTSGPERRRQEHADGQGAKARGVQGEHMSSPLVEWREDYTRRTEG